MSRLDPRWGPGLWDSEPDLLVWTYDARPCVALRAPLGNWNGYVGVGGGHPLYEDRGADLEAHGGITWANTWINHVEPDWQDIWWFGFDCAHWDDLVPGMATYTGHEGEYRTLAYVAWVCEDLVAQLNKLTVHGEVLPLPKL